MTGHLTAVNTSRDRRSPRARPRKGGWRRESIRLFRALVDYRLTLRTTARRAGDQATAQRLRMLARRTKTVTAMLKRLDPALDPEHLDLDLDPVSGDPLWLAGSGEIGAIGACVRRNRRVRDSASKIVEAGSPGPISRFATRLRDQAEREAWELNSILRTISLPPAPESPGVRQR